MKQELKKEFADRMIRSNRSELVVILYELTFAYFDDVRESFKNGDWENAKKDLDNAERVIRRLMDDLNFQYPISKQFFSLYHFSLKEMAKIRIKKNIEPLTYVEKILRNLYDGFVEIAKNDHSPAIMQNVEQVTVGLTYGKNNIQEIYSNLDGKRGYYV